MIATILPGSTNFHAVGYNEHKVSKGVARLIEIQNFGSLGTFHKPTPSELVGYLQKYSSQNSRIRKPQFHVAISCKGHEMSEDELLDFAHQYLKEMGYGESGQPLLVYSHYDTENTHLHIVTSRVAPDGRKIQHSHERRRSQEVIDRILGNDRKKKTEDDIDAAKQYTFSSFAQFKAIMVSMGYEVYQKDENVRIEGLALPAPEAFDKGCFAFGYKVGNLAVGELLLPLATEDGKPTIDVAALGDLRVKEDATGTALGARDMSAVRHRYLHLQEFFGNLGGIDLDGLAEAIGIHLPALDLGEGGLPLPGHLDIGDALVLHYLIHGKPLVGRHEALLLPVHVVTGKEGLYDGGTGGGRADTVPFQTVSKLVVLQLPAAMLHR